MKFSVWDYSQVKIAQFNQTHPQLALDPTDIFIFTWFKGFATKTRSKTVNGGEKVKRMWTKTIDGADYFLVRYEAIIKDFPILSFSSVKSIQRRFDKYVEAGIFEKIIVRAGKKGNFAYFAFTDLFWSFEYDADNPEHKQIGADNSVQTKQVGADNFVQTKQVGVDSFVQTKQVGVDNSVQTKQVGVDNFVHTVSIYPTTSLNNPATTSKNSDKNLTEKSERKTHCAAEAEAEAVFFETLTKLFGYNPCFSPDPYPDLIQNFKNCDLSKKYLPEYLTKIYGELKSRCKNQDNFASYFYKSFTQTPYISKFANDKNLELKKIAEKQSRMISCPVCGVVHDKNDFFCPNEDCGLLKDYLDSPADLEKQKAIFRLKKTDEAKYFDYKKALDEISRKYPMRLLIADKNKKNEFNDFLKQLESEFLNI